MSLDIVIRNGRVMDGTGNPWFRADVGVEEGTVTTVGNLKGMNAKKIINAKGMIVAPGFIDIHSHSDVPILIDRRGLSKIRQGVTTEVVGNCGSSAAPVNDSVREYREKYGRSSVPDDFHITWGTMAEYMDEMDGGASLNIAPLVGHGTVRQDVMEYENREPTDAELNKMKKLVAEAMADGAWGL
ncbi:MAG TPA: amidohydrolase family protein, partial [Candidatus Bathyarchaeia archaeon]